MGPPPRQALFSRLRLVLLLVGSGLRNRLALSRAGLDFDRLGSTPLRFHGFSHPDAQHASIQRGVDILLLGPEGQGDRAIKRAVGAFLDMPVFLVLLRLLLLFAGKDVLTRLSASHAVRRALSQHWGAG